ncbi:uncharacterized protein F4807DRAFT_224145 [Annulohypoxylon truncatum]|uniref:uncharacterized protein n=1 Tax=Annulohypoxylon truncatum TaxID=327061 RepID=UPI0020077685|nr:uncharacterized protein F4807DRAFT_224145 [Annulohypoxylon truncatum]KAI1206548.1 hypothetical protein F4807DRAFT_224145 [Annulohypoxylon truncatum]
MFRCLHLFICLKLVQASLVSVMSIQPTILGNLISLSILSRIVSILVSRSGGVGDLCLPNVLAYLDILVGTGALLIYLNYDRLKSLSVGRDFPSLFGQNIRRMLVYIDSVAEAGTSPDLLNAEVKDRVDNSDTF